MAAAICLIVAVLLFAMYGFEISDLPLGLNQTSLLGFGLVFVALALLMSHLPESWRR